MQGAYRVGVDIGGTFTDIVVSADDGALARRKLPSTAGDHTDAVTTAKMVARLRGATAAKPSDTTTENHNRQRRIKS
jgi:N-methylhydantoinase A